MIQDERCPEWVVEKLNRATTDIILVPSKSFVFGDFETFGALMSGVSGIVSQGRSDDYLDSLPELYRSMTVDNINSVAAKYIDTNIWTWMIVGDLSKIEEGIRELNLGEIEIIKLD